MRRVPVLAALLVACGLSAVAVQACPFCAAPSLTLSEQLKQSRAAVIAEWTSAVRPDGQSVASTTLTVRDVLSESSLVKAGETVTLTEYRAGQTGDLFLLLANDGQPAGESAPTFLESAGYQPKDFAEDAVALTELTTSPETTRWSSPIEVTAATADYIAALPGDEAEDRLAFFMDYLEHPDETISSDAYSEFAGAPYDVIRPLAPQMPVEKLREWVASSDTPPTRLGLYGLMLGLAGDETDKARMEKRILEPTDEFRLGIDGVMGGYMLLAGEPGLSLIEKAKFEDPDVPFSETYAAMQAIRFLWSDANDSFGKDRLRQSMRTLLERPELADLVIADLARWKDWSQVDRVYDLYDADGYDTGSIKRAIVRFMLAATKVEDEPPTAEQEEKAAGYLARLREEDPKTVKAAERFFFLN